MKLVYLVGFIIKKFVTMYGHTKAKFLFSRTLEFLDVQVYCLGVALPRCLRCNRLPTMYPVSRNVCDGRTVSLDKTTKPKGALYFVYNAISVYSVMV
jgi:hypothetical protein